MTTLVTRLYDNADRAHAAAKTLKSTGFPADRITIVSDAASAVADMKKVGVYAKATATYAAAVAKGNAVLIAEAPMGTSFKVSDILEDTGAIASGVDKPNMFRSEMGARERGDLLTGYRFGGNPYLLLTGARMSGNPWLLMTGTRWCGNKLLLMTGSRWSGNKMFKSDRHWSGNNKLLLTGTRWGGPVPRIWDPRGGRKAA
jgi:hypothetical protein